MNQMITLGTICLMASVLAQVGSCGASNTKAGNMNSNVISSGSDGKLATGIWGGQHVHAEVSETGAQFEFDCAHGAITQSIPLDATGKFDVPGKFAPEHGGPVRRDEESNDRAVRYAGRVNQQEMALTISDAGTKEEIGTFQLRHGSEGRLMKCR
jgi:hypothetical protein